MTNYTLTIGDEVHQLEMNYTDAWNHSVELLTSRARSLINENDYPNSYNGEQDSYGNEVRNYRELQRYGITPVLVECRESVITAELTNRKNRPIEEYDVSIIILTKIGMSLHERFVPVPENYGGEYLGPGPSSQQLIDEDETFDSTFPEVIFSDNIRGKIRELLMELTQLGWCHDDVHSGNILIEDDKLYLIDLELMTRI